MLKLPKPSPCSSPDSKIDTDQNGRTLSWSRNRKVANKSLASESISTHQMEFNDFWDEMKSIPTTEPNGFGGGIIGIGDREFGTASTKYIGHANIKSEAGEFIWYFDPHGDISTAKFETNSKKMKTSGEGGVQVKTIPQTKSHLSPPFIAGFSIGIPCEWSLQFIARGAEEGEESYIGLGLRLHKFLRQTETSARHVAVHYQVAHLSQTDTGTGHCILRKESAIRTFGPDDLAFGWTEFLPRGALVPDSEGKFIFAVYLNMYEMTIPEAYDKQFLLANSDEPMAPIVPLKRRKTDESNKYSHSQHLNSTTCSTRTIFQMQNPGLNPNSVFTLCQTNHSHFIQNADVELCCHGEIFRTTLKSLTDQSDYFRKIMAQEIEADEPEETKGNGEHHISPKMPKITIDFCDASTFEVVLDFCRTKQLHRHRLPDYPSALALLQAAMKLNISGLDKLCIIEILCLLTPHNFPAIVYNLWLFQVRLSLGERDVLENFFETNQDLITSGLEFKNYYRQNPFLFFDMLL